MLINKPKSNDPSENTHSQNLEDDFLLIGRQFGENIIEAHKPDILWENWQMEKFSGEIGLYILLQPVSVLLCMQPFCSNAGSANEFCGLSAP